VAVNPLKVNGRDLLAAAQWRAAAHQGDAADLATAMAAFRRCWNSLAS
jgi:hypothetical protein